MEWIDEEIIQEKGTHYFKSFDIPKKIIYLFFFTLFFYYAVFIKFSVFENQKWKTLAEKNQSIEIFTPAPRGFLLDRNKKIIVENENTFDLIADISKINSDTLKEIEDIITKYNLDSEITSNIMVVKNLPRDIAFNFMVKYPQSLEIRIINSYKRKYNFDEELSNLIGYLGFPDEEEIKELNVQPNEYIGKTGIEKTYDKFLRGEKGYIKIIKDAKANILKIADKKDPKMGSSLVLTIDLEFQKNIYKIMKQYMEENGYKKGGVIALNPDTGEILALISYPSFDINKFTKERYKIKDILNNPLNPLFNRVIGGLYAPGSVIKPILAVGALEEKIINPEKKIYSSGELRIPNPYLPGVYSIFKDWKVHGYVNMKEAIANSVNVYFYTIGGGYGDQKGLGIYNIKKYFELFGLGKKTGIDLLGEKAGFIPTPESKRKTNKLDPIWRLGDTYNISIGQGDLLVTPIQIAVFTSALATNKIVQPFLVKEILDYKGNKLFERKIKVLKERLVNPENLKIVQEGMRMTVTQGTAKILSDFPIPIAGKSGTPQILGKRKLNAFFAGYAPYSNPEIVLVVFIEEVPEGSVSTLPLFREIMRIYFSNHPKYKNLFLAENF